MKKSISKEVIIGFTTVVSLVLLYIGVNYLKGVNLFKPANYYYVSCTNVKDINVSSPVFVEGFKVGLVRDITYDYSTVDKITLEVRLDRGMKVSKGSYVTIESTLLSGAELHLNLNKFVAEYHKPGDVLEGRFREGMITSVEGTIIPMISELMPKLDSILTGLQALINNPAISQSLTNLENTTAQLKVSSVRLDEFIKTDVPAIAIELKETTQNLSTFSHNLNNLNFDQSVQSLNATLDNLNALSLQLNSEESTLGLFLNDSTLYNNLNRTISSASDLLIDIKQNPKKYVRFSLF